MVMVMDVAFHELMVTGVPFRDTALVPRVAPKPVPVMTTWVPTGPVVGEMPEMFGAGAAAEEMETLSKVAVAREVLVSALTAKPM
jgi:hypothetical protein